MRTGVDRAGCAPQRFGIGLPAAQFLMGMTALLGGGAVVQFGQPSAVFPRRAWQTRSRPRSAAAVDGGLTKAARTGNLFLWRRRLFQADAAQALEFEHHA